MSRRSRLVGRRIAIPLLGALLTAALASGLAWSQGTSRRGTMQTARLPLNAPALAPAQRAADEPAREAIAPPAGEALENYTVPLRRATDGLVLDSEDGLVSLVARNASLRDVLTALAETQGLNLIIQDSVDSQINTTLHRVPFHDVLDVVLSTCGYTWVRNRNVIQVTSISNSQNLAPEAQGRQVEAFQLDFVSATDVSTVVETMLSPAGSANVILASEEDNRKTQELLVVQDLPSYLENIRRYIQKHDVPPRQVLIEAYILKVELSDDMRHGVNFDHVFKMSKNLFQIESRGLANDAATQGFMVHLSGGNLAAVVEMLETTTDAKTLASPKIRVLNGQTAHIQVGEQLGFRVTTTTQTSTLEGVQFLEVGVVLKVTPRIGSDGTVIMQVSPKVSSGRVNPDTGLPEETTTELQTDVMFHDNQAYVIGGLIQETDADVQRKLPWFGDLKHVGHLFQRSEVLKRRSEVIVALLPRVIPFDPVTNENLLLETDRATTPLLYGPLLEYPRPWEPELPHVVKNPKMLRLPPIWRRARFKGGGSGTPESALEPIEAINYTARTTDAPRGFVSPAETTSWRPDASRAIGPQRLPRVPAIWTRPPVGSGEPASGTLLR